MQSSSVIEAFADCWNGEPKDDWFTFTLMLSPMYS